MVTSVHNTLLFTCTGHIGIPNLYLDKPITQSANQDPCLITNWQSYSHQAKLCSSPGTTNQPSWGKYHQTGSNAKPRDKIQSNFTFLHVTFSMGKIHLIDTKTIDWNIVICNLIGLVWLHIFGWIIFSLVGVLWNTASLSSDMPDPTKPWAPIYGLAVTVTPNNRKFHDKILTNHYVKLNNYMHFISETY